MECFKAKDDDSSIPRLFRLTADDKFSITQEGYFKGPMFFDDKCKIIKSELRRRKNKHTIHLFNKNITIKIPEFHKTPYFVMMYLGDKEDN